MAEPSKRLLRVFLCHASADKASVRAFYKRLVGDGVDAWLDQEKLLPGENWREEIPKAVRASDIVIVCLSKNSINRDGYVQREIRIALDSAEEKPDGTIFIIPARLEDCEVPDRLRTYQWVDLFIKDGYNKLKQALIVQAIKLGCEVPSSPKKGLPQPPTPVESEAQKLFNEATAFNLRGDAERALQLYRRVKEIDPYFPGVDLEIRNLEREIREGKVGPDGRVLDEKLRKLFDEATALSLRGDAERALRVYRRVKEIDPYFPEVDLEIRNLEEEVGKRRRISLVAWILLLLCLGIALLFTNPILSSVLGTTISPTPDFATVTSQSQIVSPTASTPPIPTLTFTPGTEEQIAIVNVEAPTGSLVPVSSTSCLWTEVSGQGASLTLTLEQESTIDRLRIALFTPFVQTVRLTFSDNSQQTVTFDEIRDYEYQEVFLDPVKTSKITVEVVEVRDNSFNHFGICHIELFGSKVPTTETPASGLTLVRTIPGTDLVASAAISSDGTILALAQFDGTIRVLSTREDRLIGSFKAGTGILSLALSPDNQRLAAGLTSTTVKVWQLNDGVELPSLEGLSSGVFNVAFSQDGQMVAASAKPDLILWRVSDGSILQRFTGISAIFTNMAFSPDGNLVASGFEALTVRVWLVNNGKAVHDLKSANARTLAFSRDGEILAVLGQGTNIDLWRMQDGTSVLPALTGHTQMIESLAFSRDNQTLVTASRDIEVRRWQVSDHKRLYTLKEDGTDVRSVLLSGDGQTLIALYMDGKVNIWQVP
jgi:WD40 repeat protein